MLIKGPLVMVTHLAILLQAVGHKVFAENSRQHEGQILHFPHDSDYYCLGKCYCSAATMH